MHLLSPKNYNFKGIIASVPVSYKIDDPITGEKLEKNMNRYFMAPRVGNEAVIKVDTYSPTQEQMLTHFSLQNLINHCINDAELINDTLKTIVLKSHASNLDERQALAKADFMSLRDKFSKFIKKYPRLNELPPFETPKKVGVLTKVFHQYIGDRNIYTHGRLGYHTNRNVFCIKYFDGKKTEYAEINKEILRSFLQCGTVIKDFLSKLHRKISEDAKKKSH